MHQVLIQSSIWYRRATRATISACQRSGTTQQTWLGRGWGCPWASAMKSRPRRSIRSAIPASEADRGMYGVVRQGHGG